MKSYDFLASVVARVARLFLKKPLDGLTTNHARNIETAARRLNTLIQVGHNGGFPALIAYLRKIDPYVFEELLLTAIEQKQHVVVRNVKYSHDGGIDGEFLLNDKKVLIQAKRYRSYIKTAHVLEFKSKCEVLGVKGLFIHTGKTRSSAKLISGDSIEIISGAKLISLLLPTNDYQRIAKQFNRNKNNRKKSSDL